MPNIEIKAKCNNLENARSIAARMQTEYLGVLHQVDTYFSTKAGRLKLREINGNTAQLIPYSKGYQTGPMQSDYALLSVENPKHLKGLLNTLLGTEFVVDKKREVFLIENVRVHLDEVAELGSFLELEAVYENTSPEERAKQVQKVQNLMEVFGIRAEDLLDRSYVDYLANSRGSGTQILG
jgi:adenylate cyclase, class 2